MNIPELLDQLLSEAHKNYALRERLLKTRESENPL